MKEINLARSETLTSYLVLLIFYIVVSNGHVSQIVDICVCVCVCVVSLKL